MNKTKIKKQLLNAIVTTLTLAIVVLVWDTIIRFNVITSLALPSPGAVLIKLSGIRSSLPKEMATTFYHMALGIVPGSLLGILLGISVGWFKPLEMTLGKILNILLVVPKVAFLPLLIVLIGPNETTVVVLVAISSFFAVYITVFSGAKKIDSSYIETYKNLGGKGGKALYQIVFPASMPYITTGLRHSIGRSLTSAIVGEMFLAKGGLGGILWRAGNLFLPELGFAVVLVIAVIAVVFFEVFDLLENKLLPWKK